MSIEKIIKDITSGLKGDPREDFKYLMEQGEKYKNDENVQEILRAIGRIIHGILPEDVQKNFDKERENFHANIVKNLEEIDLNINNKDSQKALELAGNLVKELEEMGWYKDDQVSQYHCFFNPLEEILFKILFKPQKEVREIPVYYYFAYYKYGKLLLEQGRYKEAKNAFLIVEKYNPIDTRVKFELAEIFKNENDLVNYLETNKKIYEYLYTNESLCRYYCNMGYYYAQKKNYDLSIDSFAVALLFMQITDNPEQEITDNDKTIRYEYIREQLEDIKQKTGKVCIHNIPELKKRWRIMALMNFTNKGTDWKLEIPNFTDEEALRLNDTKKHLEENGLFFGANEKILTIMKELAQDAIYQNVYSFARNIYNLLFELTNGDYYKDWARKLPKKDGGRESKSKTKKGIAKKETGKKEIGKKSTGKKEPEKKVKKSNVAKSSGKMTVSTKEGEHLFDITGVKGKLKVSPMGQEVELVIFETSTGMDFVKIIAPDTMPGIFSERMCGDYLYPGIEKTGQALVFLKVDDVVIPCDLIDFKNEKTEEEKQIYFDVSSFYGSPI